jgi:hypothetical protein
MHPVINLEHLRKYYPADETLGEHTKLPSTRDYLRASDKYVVEAILGHRVDSKRNGRQRSYQVRWEGYGPADNTWVSETDLRNAPTLKREYMRMHGLK